MVNQRDSRIYTNAGAGERGLWRTWVLFGEISRLRRAHGSRARRNLGAFACEGGGAVWYVTLVARIRTRESEVPASGRATKEALPTVPHSGPAQGPVARKFTRHGACACPGATKPRETLRPAGDQSRSAAYRWAVVGTRNRRVGNGFLCSRCPRARDRQVQRSIVLAARAKPLGTRIEVPKAQMSPHAA